MPVMKERLKETIAFRVSDRVFQALESVASAERRENSEVARALLERGLAAHARDGKLFEPEQSNTDKKRAGAPVGKVRADDSPATKRKEG